jgi:RHS repeat-associated protein
MINNASRFEHGEMGGGKLYGEYDNAGVLIREYIWLNGEPLAQIDKNGGTETVTYLHTDHLATPRYGTNAAGSAVWTWDSGAFGKEAPTGTATVNVRFPGQYFDSETTLYYNWNRYYNASTGRYISSDPIGIDAGLGTYLYVSQSPLISVDPKGLVQFSDGFPDDLKGSVLEAARHAMIKLTLCRGDCKKCVPDSHIERMLSNLNAAYIDYVEDLKNDKDELVCAGASRKRIVLSGLAMTDRKKCACSLAALLAHESFHVGQPEKSKIEEQREELESVAVEVRCFGCKRSKIQLEEERQKLKELIDAQ